MKKNTIELKCWPEYFEPLYRGDKSFELRWNDRPYEVGKILYLREWNPVTSTYTGRHVLCPITYILNGPVLGLQAGWVILGLGDTHPCS